MNTAKTGHSFTQKKEKGPETLGFYLTTGLFSTVFPADISYKPSVFNI